MQVLKSITGFWFYVLGFILLASYVSVRGEVLGVWPAYALQYLDLPFILSGLLYGAVNLYESVHAPGKKARVLLGVLSIGVAAMFGVVLVMNFWVA